MNNHEIFCKHVINLMQKQNLNKLDLAEKADVSVSFISDITTMKGNPSLKVMSQIANALEVPLSLLLLDPESDFFSCLSSMSACFNDQKLFYSKSVGDNLEEVTALVTPQKAWEIKKWAANTQKNKK